MKSAVTVALVPEARKGPFVFHDDLIASAEAAAQLGFDSIEIFTPAPDAIDPTELRELLDRCGLGLAAVGTGAGAVKHGLTLVDPDDEKRGRAVQFVKDIIDFAGPFGAFAIIGSMQGWAKNNDGASDRLRAALDECGEHAAGHGVPLIYEPLNRYETDHANTMAEGVELLESLDTKNVKLLADLFHMNIEEESIAAGIKDGGAHIGHVHFVDSNRRPMGCGHMDGAAAVNALKEIGYEGYLSAEAFPWPDSQRAATATIGAFREMTA